jgi:hypothetical protein
MSNRMTLLVFILGPLLAWAAGSCGPQKACDPHNPEMNLKQSPLDCAKVK